MSILNFPRVPSRLATHAAVSLRIELALLALIHFAALAIFYATEWGELHCALALLTWGFLNFTWLAILRRPAGAVRKDREAARFVRAAPPEG